MPKKQKKQKFFVFFGYYSLEFLKFRTQTPENCSLFLIFLPTIVCHLSLLESLTPTNPQLPTLPYPSTTLTLTPLLCLLPHCPSLCFIPIAMMWTATDWRLLLAEFGNANLRDNIGVAQISSRIVCSRDVQPCGKGWSRSDLKPGG